MTRSPDDIFRDDARFAKIVKTSSGSGLLIGGTVIGLDCDEKTALRLAKTLRRPSDPISELSELNLNNLKGEAHGLIVGQPS